MNCTREQTKTLSINFCILRQDICQQYLNFYNISRYAVYTNVFHAMSVGATLERFLFSSILVWKRKKSNHKRHLHRKAIRYFCQNEIVTFFQPSPLRHKMEVSPIRKDNRLKSAEMLPCRSKWIERKFWYHVESFNFGREKLFIWES